jgi:hypothetical protein
MRLRFPSLIFTFAALLVGLTCDDGGRPVSLAEQIAQSFCAHRFKCCSPFEIATVTSERYRTEQECVAYATIAVRQQLATIEGAMDLGRISADPARTESCLRAYRERVCNLSTQTPETIGPVPNAAEVLAFCPDMLVGRVPAGRACNVTQECAPGSRCLTGSPGNGGFAGTFGGMPNTPPSALGSCVPYQKAGEHCNVTLDCDPAAPLTCLRPEFVCGPAAQAGEPCMTEVDFNTYVVSSNCDTSQRLTCDDFTMKCRRYPRAGEPCEPFRTPQCDPDPALALSCDPFSGICKRPGNEGDACGAPAIPPCRDDLSCHPTQSDGIGTCGAVPQLGEACTERCASPSVCNAGFCGLPGSQPLGSPCARNSECASLTCTGFSGTSSVCASPMLLPRCVGAGVTQGALGGFGGTGFGGFGGFATGTGGTGVIGGRGGTGGFGGNMPPPGCMVSDPAPEDPVIADFTGADGSTTLPIGGLFVYPPMGPVATITNGALRVTANTSGTPLTQFWGAGIYFNGDPTGLSCIDGTSHTGVQFDISGTIAGAGCTAQYSTNDSAHSNSAVDPKGSGDASSFAPQAPLTVSATVTTVLMPFAGTGAPTGGNPPTPVDPARLTGVQWQFTTAAGAGNGCNVDITIDNVRFF